MLEALAWLHEQCTVVYHNALYDREVLALAGMRAAAFRPFPHFFDTMHLAYQSDPNLKRLSLKALSETVLGRPMIHISELFLGLGTKPKKNAPVTMEQLPAETAFVYTASDACNTRALFDWYWSLKDGLNPFHGRIPLQLDHKLIETVRSTNRNGLPINLRFAQLAGLDALARAERFHDLIMEIAGHNFNINSQPQLSRLLFDEMQVPLPPNAVRGKNGTYSTEKDILEALNKQYEIPVLRYIVQFRKFQYSARVYARLLANAWVDDYLPVARGGVNFKLTNAPTGRFSSDSQKGIKRVVVRSMKSGGLKYELDKGAGTVGVNVQAIAKATKRKRGVKRIKRLAGWRRDAVSLQALYGISAFDKLVAKASEPNKSS